LWDAARKCIAISSSLASQQHIQGWRKAIDWEKRIKIQFRKLQKVKKSVGKNKEFRLKYAVKEYLDLVKILQRKVAKLKGGFKASTLSQYSLLFELEYYIEMLIKHIDLVERRLLKGEIIPHNEKLFSIFEPHTKWISKGKAGVLAELGQKHLIVTDQNHFIVYHRLIGDTPDAVFTIELAKELKNKFANRLTSLSFDKGFSSKEIITELEGIIPKPILKQKGKPNKDRLEIQRSKDFKKLNNSHQAVESNINQLTYHGLDKCTDKGEPNFQKYVSLAVLSYNLHRLGKAIKEKSTKDSMRGSRKSA